MPLNNDLWTCPECGHQFVNANTYHSCGNYDLADHFLGKDEQVREIFDALVDLVEGIGPVTIYAQKTRIVFQVRTRFASVVTRKSWLVLQIWLKRKAGHPLLQRIEMYTYRDYGLIIRLKKIADIDEALSNLIHEAYALGSQ
jgi:hypothetical protein